MILTLGSVNIDNVYRVASLPRPGETVSDLGHAAGLGGKGANQSLAAAAAGAEVRHCGAIGADGGWCRAALARAGIDVDDLVEVTEATGHAVVMVDRAGENAIIIHSGANLAIPEAVIDRALARARPGDWLLAQNETNRVAETAAAARARGLRVAYAAAPFDPGAAAQMLALTDLLVVNAVEAAQLAAHTGQDPAGLAPAVLISRGADGADWHDAGACLHVPAFPVTPVDTTGAGDTLTGWFLAGLDRGLPAAAALGEASAAAALQVTRPGAADAIPTRAEVLALLAEHRA